MTLCVLFKTSAKTVLFYLRQDSLTAHNAYRAKHGVPALKLNDELNDVAQVQQLMRWRHRFTIANNKGGEQYDGQGKGLYQVLQEWADYLMAVEGFEHR